MQSSERECTWRNLSVAHSVAFWLTPTDCVPWFPALPHDGAPIVLARTLAAKQPRRRGRPPAVRRCQDTMIGAGVTSETRHAVGGPPQADLRGTATFLNWPKEFA